MRKNIYEAPYDNVLDDAYRTVFADITHDKYAVGGSRDSDGGKAIASGGYGCVFRPAIACKGESKPRSNSISKLMTRTKAEAEMDEVRDAKSILEKIPDYSKYFALTNYHMCVPGKLTEEDEKSFDVECRGPLAVPLAHVNKHPDTYRLVISPDLGTDLSKAVKSMFKNAATTPGSEGYKDLLRNLVNLNNTSADFLQNGLAKMARLRFYHSDVKPQNVMTDYNVELSKPSFTQMKLIDFGLALPHGGGAEYVNTFIMFNAPVSGFMFDRSTVYDINHILRRASHVNDQQYESFVSNEMEKVINKHVFRDSSRTHIPYMEGVGSAAYGISGKKFRTFLKRFYVAYCSDIVISFTKRGYDGNPAFDMEKYWDEVLRFNLDIWGFLTTFLLMASYSRNSHPDIAAKYLAIVEGYLYTTAFASRKIPVDDVVTSLTGISADFTKQLTPSRPVAAVKRITIQPKKVVRTQKKRLVVVKDFKASNEQPLRSVVSVKSNKKRCPKGYVRHRKDKTKCVKRVARITKGVKEGVTLKGKRCPKGYRRHKTQKERCVPIARK